MLGGILFSFEGPESRLSPAPTPHVEAKRKPSDFVVSPTWPSDVQAGAIGAVGEGVLATHGGNAQRPIASIAKVITALAILEKHPLNREEQGPSIPITPADEQRYRDYIAQNGSVVAVQAGVALTEYQALQAMLLPSANNASDTAALWAFGSMQNYHNYANAMLQRQGLKNTVVGGDASGLDPASKSTPTDLILLGELALRQPVIAEIVAQKEAIIPFAGTIPNYNRLVTQYGFSGIKPGDSNEAGVTLLFSAQHTFKGKPVHLIGVLLGGGETYTQEDALHTMESAKATLRTR